MWSDRHCDVHSGILLYRALDRVPMSSEVCVHVYGCNHFDGAASIWRDWCAKVKAKSHGGGTSFQVHTPYHDHVGIQLVVCKTMRIFRSYFVFANSIISSDRTITGRSLCSKWFCWLWDSSLHFHNIFVYKHDPLMCGLHVPCSVVVAAGIIPTYHFGSIVDYSISSSLTIVISLLIMFSFYGTGLVLYAFQIPERRWPGYFDYVFASHQWWHLCVTLAVFSQYIGVFYTFKRISQGLDACKNHWAIN